MRLCQSVRYALGIYAICFLLNGISSTEDAVQEHNTAASKASNEPEGRALFNPRVDYNNQWMPVGHSDPLKNEPTFDYVPPTLGSVRYWSEEGEDKKLNKNITTKSSGKDEILLLGAPVEHSVNPPSNHLQQAEPKSADRRSSPYYPPEPQRHLMPPSPQAYMASFDKSSFPAEHNHRVSSSNYWNNNDLPISQTRDAFPEESASYVTVIRPKTNPHPYSSTIYNKNVRNSIYHLAANVNSLEPVDKKPHWVHTFLQKEITHQVQATTPQVVLAYSPHIYEPLSTKTDTKTDAHLKEDATFAEPTTAAPMSLTTDSLFSHYKQPSLPVRGPMYLIIQGHSKVKTYGPDGSTKKTEKHEAKMVPVVAREDPVITHVASTDSIESEIQVKHLHKLQETNAKSKAAATNRPAKKVITPMYGSLLSLLDSSLASFGLNDKEAKTKTNELKKSNNRATTSTSRPSTILGPTTIRANLDS